MIKSILFILFCVCILFCTMTLAELDTVTHYSYGQYLKLRELECKVNTLECRVITLECETVSLKDNLKEEK